MNEIKKLSDIPVRWYTVVIRGGESFQIDENTVEQIIKADKIVVLRDNQNRLIRYINKVDIADIHWDKAETKTKFLSEKDGKHKLLSII